MHKLDKNLIELVQERLTLFLAQTEQDSQVYKVHLLKLFSVQLTSVCPRLRRLDIIPYFQFISLCVSVSQSDCLSVCLSVCLSIGSVRLSVCLCVYLSDLSVYLSVCVSIYRICQSICLSACLSIGSLRLSVYLSQTVSLSIWQRTEDFYGGDAHSL